MTKCLSFFLALCVLFCSSASVVFATDESTPESQSIVEAEPQELLPTPTSGQGLYQPPFELEAEAVCLLNEETGVAVYEKNADEPMTAASLVKLMTAILVIENVEDLDAAKVTADDSWVFDELYGKNASHADIRLGETLSVRELLYALLLPSANEAALLLADYISNGYMQNFLYMMNARAEALGCTNTSFVDPNGLSEENLTTARDMCLIMRAFMQYPELVDIAATSTYEMAAHEKHAEPYLIQNTNRLMTATSPYYDAFPGSTGTVKAGKTGSLGEWQNFVSYALGEDESYICTVLHSPNEADALGANLDPAQARPGLYESAKLYDWAFAELLVRPALDTTEPITEIRVRYSTEEDNVKLLPSSSIRALLPAEADDSMLEKQFDVPEYVTAPIAQGDVVGTVTLTLGGYEIGTADLLAAYSVERNNTLYAVKKVEEFFGSTYFRVLLILLLLVAIIYISVVAFLINLSSRKKNKGPNRPKGH